MRGEGWGERGRGEGRGERGEGRGGGERGEGRGERGEGRWNNTFDANKRSAPWWLALPSIEVPSSSSRYISFFDHECLPSRTILSSKYYKGYNKTREEKRKIRREKRKKKEKKEKEKDDTSSLQLHASLDPYSNLSVKSWWRRGGMKETKTRERGDEDREQRESEKEEGREKVEGTYWKLMSYDETNLLDGVVIVSRSPFVLCLLLGSEIRKTYREIEKKKK